uniref:Uncharacterized protein n=1 Tax=Solanum lycopersicum TaxID=4081 RepID=A0A3Q7GSX1_SOLLC
MMMTYHARRLPTVCATTGRLWYATPDVTRPCVLHKGHAGMPFPTSSDRVCSPRAMITCHARCRSIVYAFQGLYYQATPKVIRPCVLPKGDDGMPCPTSSYNELPKGDDSMGCSTSSNHV